jgi:hypothetical protein
VVPQTAATNLAGIYFCFAAALTGTGGVMLIATRPLGRQLISWGLMLKGLLAFFALIVVLMRPEFEDAEMYIRRIPPEVAIIIAAHIVLDTVLGTLGQRVGRLSIFTSER